MLDSISYYSNKSARCCRSSPPFNLLLQRAANSKETKHKKFICDVVEHISIEKICAKDYNMNCPMFAYVLGRFILRLYTNYMYITYRGANIIYLPTNIIYSLYQFMFATNRILKIYLMNFFMLCKVFEFVVWI